MEEKDEVGDQEGREAVRGSAGEVLVPGGTDPPNWPLPVKAEPVEAGADPDRSGDHEDGLETHTFLANEGCLREIFMYLAHLLAFGGLRSRFALSPVVPWADLFAQSVEISATISGLMYI